MANGRDKKDEIINLQLDLIRKMTENNIKRLSDDIWGSTRTNANPPQKPQTSAKTGTPAVPQNPAPVKPVRPSDADFIKASDGGDGAKPAEPEETLPEKENIDDLRKELDSYIGLDEVKKEVKSLINMATVYKMRRDNNLPTADVSLHMVFSGNPGTGKTMIARLMSRIYHSLGILSKGQLVEVDRSGLVAGYVGQTAGKTTEVIKMALGGVLFIDEAYTLINKSENDFGQEAVDTILKAMEDNRDDLVVIVAGYTELMEEFIHSNPGLESRFNRFMHFPDYTIDEMMGIFDMRCGQSGYALAEDAKDELKAILEEKSKDVGGFGNARGVRNLFEKAIAEQADRLAASDEPLTKELLMTLTEADLKAASEKA